MGDDNVDTHLRNPQPIISLLHGLTGIPHGLIWVPFLPVRAQTCGRNEHFSNKGTMKYGFPASGREKTHAYKKTLQKHLLGLAL